MAAWPGPQVCSQHIAHDVCSTGLPQGWSSTEKGAVKDKLETIYPWTTTCPEAIAPHANPLQLTPRQAYRHKVVSLFSGILGLELGLRWLAAQTQNAFQLQLFRLLSGWWSAGPTRCAQHSLLLARFAVDALQVEQDPHCQSVI